MNDERSGSVSTTSGVACCISKVSLFSVNLMLCNDVCQNSEFEGQKQIATHNKYYYTDCMNFKETFPRATTVHRKDASIAIPPLPHPLPHFRRSTHRALAARPSAQAQPVHDLGRDDRGDPDAERHEQRFVNRVR